MHLKKSANFPFKKKVKYINILAEIVKKTLFPTHYWQNYNLNFLEYGSNIFEASFYGY